MELRPALGHGADDPNGGPAGLRARQTWQNQKRGEDPEQAERLESLKKEIAAAAALIELTGDFI